MIARVWHGWTSRANADSYERLLLTDMFPRIAGQGIPGFRGAYLYRRELETETEFVTTLQFDSIDDVRAFAGADYEVAVIHEDARPLFTRFDARSAHYEIVARP
jgi:heme-degrading monooxygenase HmoA